MNRVGLPEEKGDVTSEHALDALQARRARGALWLQALTGDNDDDQVADTIGLVAGISRHTNA
ncbi:MAG: hypothetical protein M3401_07395 [Actinomycetota bacterium]|nr:hypothetical protein [Actinomycetota bacterium]